MRQTRHPCPECGSGSATAFVGRGGAWYVVCDAPGGSHAVLRGSARRQHLRAFRLPATTGEVARSTSEPAAEVVDLLGDVWRAARRLRPLAAPAVYLHDRTGWPADGPWPDAVRWLSFKCGMTWPDNFTDWLIPWRKVDKTAAETGAVTYQHRTASREYLRRSDERIDADVNGLIAWRWTGGPGQSAALEVEALAGLTRRLIRMAPGRGVKRAALPGVLFGGRVFVAQRAPAGAGETLHVCEGAPDALACVASGRAGEADGVIGCHGAGALARLATDASWVLTARPWRRIAIYAHGETVGRDAARTLTGACRARGFDTTAYKLPDGCDLADMAANA